MGFDEVGDLSFGEAHADLLVGRDRVESLDQIGREQSG